MLPLFISFLKNIFFLCRGKHAFLPETWAYFGFSAEPSFVLVEELCRLQRVSSQNVSSAIGKKNRGDKLKWVGESMHHCPKPCHVLDSSVSADVEASFVPAEEPCCL